ncbi:MAG: HD-GYP domain-containing protein [Treponema sp.]|jgi:HD-GYP domain-containing protein (c-di-GMP phosphodiesterase class II)|nr:HD-GYP domain-containing protein [Treponema sp.]
MKKVAVNTLKAGMIFSEPVYIEGDNLLVPAGVAIRKKDIGKLNAWGVDIVQTEGSPVSPQAVEAKAPPSAAGETPPSQAPKEAAGPKAGDEAPEKKASLISLSEVQENRGGYRVYIDLIERLDQVFNSIAAGISVEARSIDNITGRLLQAIHKQRDSIIGYILGGEVRGHEMAKSSINTAILSALIAVELKLSNHKVAQVITGALLHDVGMLRLPKEIVDKNGSLSTAELQRIQAHPLYTYKIVNKELLYPEDVGLIVLQHHERWDGEGYPRRISGAAIDMGARIVSVADAFEAMVSKKPYRNPIMGYQAIKNLLSDNSRRFDPNVLKAFIQTMGIYPIGSIILLNSGALARVVEIRGAAPLRPKIRILIDEFGKVFKQDEGEAVDLFIEKSLFIARAVDPKEVAGRNG